MLRSNPDILANVVLVARHPNLLDARRRRPFRKRSRPRSCLSRCLGFLDLPGLFASAALVVLEHEADLVALVERPNPCGFERGRTDKHVLAAALLPDEAEAFVVLKNFTVPVTRIRGSFPIRRDSPAKKAARSTPASQSGERQMPVRAQARPQLVRRTQFRSARASDTWGGRRRSTRDNISGACAKTPSWYLICGALSNGTRRGSAQRVNFGGPVMIFVRCDGMRRSAQRCSVHRKWHAT